MSEVTLDKIVAWAKRRGFIFQTSDIYGGLANNYDYGPYGVLLKNNIRDLWWKKFVLDRDDMVGLDGAILMQGKVWEASGHVDSFKEALVEDKKTNKRYRADYLIQEWAEKNGLSEDGEGLSIEQMNEFIREHKVLSPDKNELSDVKMFNQMFETDLDFIAEGGGEIVYLRPETAQAIFVNFKNITDSMRIRIPFGIAQIGKAFRKEITKGQFIFRTIETEQMEIEFFIHPESDWEKLMEDWKAEMKSFYLSIGAAEENLRFRQHTEEELSHYSKRTYDPEYKFDFGWKEIAGLAHRQDFDLGQHIEFSNKKLQYRDPATNEVYVPHVLEPSFGLSRALLVSLYAAYQEEDLGEGKTRTVMKFPKAIAPVKVAVFPLQKDEKLKELSKSIYDSLKVKMSCEFDDAGNIGKMYRRQDEIGTPYCVTVDYDSLEDKSVTVRDRDTMEQERIAVNDLEEYFESQFN